MLWVPHNPVLVTKKHPAGLTKKINNFTMNNHNKGGRPIKSPSQKLKYRIAVKLKTEDFYRIKSNAKKAGLTNTEYVRQMAINGIVKSRITPEILDCVRKLSGMANNLNQIAKKANTVGYNDARTEYLHIANDIDNLLNNI